MILNSIDYKNIGNKPSFAVGFKPGVNIITGPNDCGKTTLKNSILYALTGMASDRDKKELYTTGIPNPKSDISLLLSNDSGDHKIIRQVVPDTNVFYDGIKKKLSKSKDIDALYDVGFDRKTIKMICDNYNFFNLSSQEQQEILFKYFSGASDIKIEEYGVTDANEKIHFFGMNASNIPIYYKKFYDMRRDLKKEIEILEISKSNKANEAQSMNINISLVELESQRTELNGKIKSNIYCNNEHTGMLHDLFAKLDEIERSQYSPKNTVTIASINAKGIANNELVNKINKFAGKCPLVEQVECGSKEHLSALANSLIAENNELRAKVIALAAEDVTAKIEFDKTKIVEITAVKTKIDNLKKKIEQDKQTSESQNVLINNENAIIFLEIEAIDRKIAILRHKESLESDIIAISKSIALKQIDLNNLEKYLELTGDGDKSIKNKIVSGNIGDFFKEITEYSREFNYEFEQNPSSKDFEILINKKTSNMLSSSGKIKASIAIQVAIAKKSGYNIIMADDIEKCESGNLMKIINALIESGVQAFLFGHNLNKALFPTTVNVIELA
jgi:hypothetical protein